MFGKAQSVQCASRIRRLRLRLKDKTELCTLKPFVCSAPFFFSLSFFFFPVSEVVVNAFGMTQADMCVRLLARVCMHLLGMCVCARMCVCV